MNSLVQQGFVLDDGVEFRFFQELPKLIIIEGRIACLGGIEVTVHKELSVLEGRGHLAMVQTTSFSYHANIRGGPNILRYDSPVPHRDFYHKHLFDTFGNNRELEVIPIQGEENVPTLSEVLEELQSWYWENRSRILGL